MADIKLIGTHIKTVRKELGLNQKNFALSLGYTPSFQSDIEKLTKTPGINVITRMIEKYNVNPIYLFTGEGEHFLQPLEDSAPEIKTDIDIHVLKNAKTEIEQFDKITWLMQNVPRIKYAIFEFFLGYEHKNKQMINDEIARILGNEPVKKD